MEQKAKQRLIGAVVLVALAVIFIPMMLNGPVDRGTVNVPIEIPPRPNMPVSGQSAAEGDQMAQQAPTPVYGQDAEAGAPADTTPPAAPTPAPKADESNAPKQDDQKPSEAGTPSKPSAEAPPVADSSEPIATKTPPELAEWAVQVGSFRDKSNAIGLRDKLRKKGYDAYVDEVKLDGKPLYRLRVGPVAKRPKAEDIAHKLKAEEKMNALVVSHSG